MIGLAHQFLCTNASNKVAEFAESNLYYGHHIYLIYMSTMYFCVLMPPTILLNSQNLMCTMGKYYLSTSWPYLFKPYHFNFLWYDPFNRTNIEHFQYGWTGTVFSSGQDEPATIENSKKWSENDLQIGACSVDSNEDKWIVHIARYALHFVHCTSHIVAVFWETMRKSGLCTSYITAMRASGLQRVPPNSRSESEIVFK